MQDVEKAYWAGILDGEGSILFTKISSGRWPAPVLSVTSTDRELLEWLRAKFGGSISTKKKYKEHWSQAYDWKITYNAAIKALEYAYPYLQIKRKQIKAKMLLDNYYQCTPRNGKYSQEMTLAKENLISQFQSL